ncbi:ATP-dependent helicase [symbiont of Argiope bruennichi]|uniref:ATP-dependent helicase n=1 Tax=symbiont of Argiope bruennichi TaxID=2810479 RepID=UPI003DA5B9E4
MNNYSNLLYLNNQQKASIFSDEYKLIKIIAGAGSGKTTVLVERLIYIKEKLNVSFAKILCIAYNTRAVKNLQTKVKTRLNIYSNSSLSNIATFHSFCLNNVLRSYFDKYGKRITVIDDDILTLSSVKKQAKDEEFINFIDKYKLFYNDKFFEDKDTVSRLLEELLVDYYEYLYKNCKKTLNEFFESKNFFVRSWPEIQQILFALTIIYFRKKFHSSIHEISVDYFDIILLSKLLLEENKEFRYSLTNYFNYILIDEFQDIDEIQYEILELLIKTNNIKSLFVVGDPDQCIYEWRRANIDILLKKIDENFKPDEIKVIVLNQNYRSGNNILSYANSLISYNKNRYKKDLFSKLPDGKVHIKHFDTQDEELKYLSLRIKELLKEKIVLPKDIICLTRTNRAISFLEKFLIEQKIPYQIFRTNSFLNQKIIKSAIYCLLFMARKSKLYFSKILEIRAIPLNIGDKTILKLVNSHWEIDDLFWNEDNLKEIFLPQQIKLLNKFYLIWQEYLKKSDKLPTNIVLHQLFDDLNFFKNQTPEQKNNLNIFIEELIHFNIPNYNLENISDYIENFFVSGMDSKSDDENKITLSTIHQAKGLEFNTVFIFDLTDKATIRSTLKRIEEERRIIFVALTRAKTTLFVSSNDGHTKANFFYLARSKTNKFISEMTTWETKKK